MYQTLVYTDVFYHIANANKCFCCCLRHWIYILYSIILHTKMSDSNVSKRTNYEFVEFG